MRKICLLLPFLFFVSFLSAQQTPIGGWQEHLSYKNALSVAEGNGFVYCVTTSGIFNYRKADNSMNRLSKVNGLSDIEGLVVNVNPYNGKVLIAYKNSNLDIVNNSIIVNISDIKRKSIIGNKSINNIYFINELAYLSCGFGIVVIDTDREEVKDTYYIGPIGTALNVKDITSDGTYLYAATDVGIYRALLSNPNLANYTSWTCINNVATGIDLTTGIYNTITTFFGKIYTNFSKNSMTGASGEDSLFVFDGTSWSHFIPAGAPITGSGYTAYSVKNNNDQLVLVFDGSVSTLNSSLVSTAYYSNYMSDVMRAKSAVLDAAGSIWFADSKYGLASWRPGIGYDYRYPNGPGSERALNMSFAEDQLWVAPGNYANYFVDGVYQLKDDQWNDIKNNSTTVHMDSIYDIMNVLVDPKDSKRVYAAAWGQGVLELNNGAPLKLNNSFNSSLSGLPFAGYNPVNTYGLALDEGSNLWVTNSGVTNCISYKTPSGVWGSLNFSPIIGITGLEQILVDKSDQKWAVLTSGLLVYKGNTFAAPNASNAKKLSTNVGYGGLPSNTVYCLAEDINNEIWIGTDKGIAVFYSPENVFSGQNFDAQQILIEQDGHVQILLETESVQAIAVDDANRKWIATSKSGVFLMSADGTKQIAHFDESNSPLFSNNVKSIAINHKTGEVYFGTTKGIISYRGTSIEALDDFTDVYAFPNPVKHDYDGPIAIKGLMNNSTLKITDISGSLVYETKSEGGQAIWYGKNFKDERVSSGVYMVFCTSEDGSKKTVTKILVIN
ncbi:MAG: hypothetical protein NTX97_11855 [Bacteroidetes bacterium]|nr:hypothetical protein [Bacteroidota bacterium]